MVVTGCRGGGGARNLGRTREFERIAHGQFYARHGRR